MIYFGNITTEKKYKRIISVVPSQTQLLYNLGLDEEVIGITKFCVHPQSWFRQKTRVGGTKTLSIDLIKELQPDLVIANKEENVKEQIDAIAAFTDVLVTDVNHLQEAITMIKEVGRLTGKDNAADRMLQVIESGFASLASIVSERKKIAVGYLIWKDPYMTVGGDTFIHDMLCRCGFKNRFALQKRYPVVDIASLHECELLLLSSEPYPFKQKHIKELQQLLPHTKIELVNGEMFSWYGSMLLQAPDYFKKLVNRLHEKNNFSMKLNA